MALQIAKFLTGVSVWVGSAGLVSANECPAALDFQKRLLAGDDVIHLCEFMQDKVVLVVNTASKCAYTPQYEGLEQLYEKYRERGLVVAGFPSNDFANQEPGSEKEIRDFCRLTYSVRFPLFEKVRVRGQDTDEFYQHLIAATGDEPRWNFHKYLIDRQGDVVASFPSQVTPADGRLIDAIEELL
jgi:glutathione peroxidase